MYTYLATRICTHSTSIPHIQYHIVALGSIHREPKPRNCFYILSTPASTSDGCVSKWVTTLVQLVVEVVAVVVAAAAASVSVH